MKSDPNAFPSLFARLIPGSRQGFTVECTATQRAIGMVFWSADGTVVTWTFRASGGENGKRSTKRGAVEALRDIANRHGHALPLFDADAHVPLPSAAIRWDSDARQPRPPSPGLKSRAERAMSGTPKPRVFHLGPGGETVSPPAPAPRATPTPVKVAQQVDWSKYRQTDINVGDLTSAIKEALDRQK